MRGEIEGTEDAKNPPISPSPDLMGTFTGMIM